MLVPIIMGSKSDLAHGQKIARALESFGIRSEIRVASAHKATRFALELIEHYEALDEPKVYVTIAGRSNALSGVVDANVTAPVVACPPYSESFGGADIFSSLRMPSGVVPTVVLDPVGAALLAAKILALGDPELREKVRAAQRGYRETIHSDDADLQVIAGQHTPG